MSAKKITRRTFLGTTAVGAASTSLSLNTWAQAINNQKSPLINGTIPALEDDVKVVNTYHEIHCHGQCMLKAHVKDGKLLALTNQCRRHSFQRLSSFRRIYRKDAAQSLHERLCGKKTSLRS